MVGSHVHHSSVTGFAEELVVSEAPIAKTAAPMLTSMTAKTIFFITPPEK